MRFQTTNTSIMELFLDEFHDDFEVLRNGHYKEKVDQ